MLTQLSPDFNPQIPIFYLFISIFCAFLKGLYKILNLVNFIPIRDIMRIVLLHYLKRRILKKKNVYVQQEIKLGKGFAAWKSEGRINR